MGCSQITYFTIIFWVVREVKKKLVEMNPQIHITRSYWLRKEMYYKEL